MSNNAEQYTVKTPEALQIRIEKAKAFCIEQSLLPNDIGQFIFSNNKGDRINLPYFLDVFVEEYSSELIKQNSEALTAYNRECERNDELQKEIDRLKGTIGVECVKQLIAAREENSELRELICGISDLAKCGYYYNYQHNPKDDKLELLARARTIASKGEAKYTMQDIKDWLH